MRLEFKSEYSTWSAMKTRCFNKNCPRYPSYGGRGITVYPEWIDSFENFIKYMGKKPSSEHSIDRIDNNGNYQPGNVRWTTWDIQANNRRNNLINMIDENDLIETLDYADEILKSLGSEPFAKEFYQTTQRKWII